MGGQLQFWPALGGSLLRSLLLAGIALLIARAVQRQLRGQGVFAWSALLLPMLTPGLLVGYCYRDTAMAWLVTSWRTELLYDLLLLGQLVPVGVALRQLAPGAAIGSTGDYCAQLLRVSRAPGRVSRLWWWRLWLHAGGQRDLTIAAVLFLIAFQEAEIASLLQARTWTEWIFTNQARGLPVLVTLRYASLAMLLQLPAVLPVAAWIASAGRQQRAQANQLGGADNAPGPGHRIAVGIWLAGAALLVTIVPAVQLLRGAGGGWGNLWQQPALGHELADALLLAVTVSLLCLISCRWWLAESQQWKRGLLVMLLPGLLGALPLGLGLAAIFQTDQLAFAYDTPVPLVLGEVLFLLPRALLVFGLWGAGREPSCQYLARLQSASPRPVQRERGQELSWRLRTQVWWWGGWLVFFWVYFELMLPSLLAQPGFRPVSLVLYNFLHYGRIDALAAKLLCALALPLLAMLLLTMLRSWRPNPFRWGRRG